MAVYIFWIVIAIVGILLTYALGRYHGFADGKEHGWSRFKREIDRVSSDYGHRIANLLELVKQKYAEGVSDGRRQLEDEIIEKQKQRRAKAEATKPALAMIVPASPPTPISKRVKTPRLGKSPPITKG